MAFITAGDSVERMASYCRIEQLLFGLLGEWAIDLDEPTAKLAMVSAADHCAWRAKRWYELLPTAPPGPDAFLTSVPGELEVFEATATIVGDSQSGRLAMAFEVLLPGIQRAMIDHLDRTTEVADAPIRRMLAIAVTDIENDRAAAVEPSRLILASSAERERAERIQAEFAARTVGISALFQV